MKNYLKILIGLALAGAIGAYVLLTPKGEVDMNQAAATHELNAGALYAAFSEDETGANAKFAGNVIQVSGLLEAVEKDEEGHYQLTLDTEDEMGAVVCTLTAAPNDLAHLEIGNSITVKGRCTGYLFDVVIDQAIIL